MALIELEKEPSGRDLRWFGLLLAAFGGLLGAFVRWRLEAPGVARAIWSAAAAIAVVYYAVVPLRRPIRRGWMYAAYPIGQVVSHLLLGAVYYLVLTPIGLVLRGVGRDPLTRKLDRGAATYWTERPAPGPVSRYFEQF